MGSENLNPCTITDATVRLDMVEVGDNILLLARTTPLDQVKKPTHGLSLFYTRFDRDRIEAREIPKMGRSAVDSNQLFIDNLVGGGSMPTIGTANITPTIAALCYRSAEHMIAQLS